jgi:hypothetical protein
MAQMIGGREDLIIHRSGHVVAFKPGEEICVPDDKALIGECIKHGHQLKKEEIVAPKKQPAAA